MTITLKNSFYLLFLLFSNLIYSQIIFEEGYLIKENGEKINCLIKNYEWKSNPDNLEYKLNKDDVSKKIKTLALQEFSVGNSKYIKAKVFIDRSSSQINNLSIFQEFKYDEETLLLKSLVEGKINLYKYYDGSLTRFFYKKENEEQINQLDYKEYLVDDRYIRKNEEYKNKLKKEFSDNDKIKQEDINRLSYRESDLKKIFWIYNDVSRPIQKNKNFHVYLKPGIGLSNYTILGYNDSSTSVNDMKTTKPLLSIAAELEFVLNFNKGKWSIISDPSFQIVNFNIHDYNRRNFEIKYTSIQLPLGMKHSMFINQRSKIYLSALFYYNLLLNKNVYSVDNISSTSNSQISRSFAVGYNYNKFGVELRWGSVPHFSSMYYGQSRKIVMNDFNLSLSYKLF